MQKKTPLWDFTVLQLAIVSVLIVSGAATLILTRNTHSSSQGTSQVVGQTSSLQPQTDTLNAPPTANAPSAPSPASTGSGSKKSNPSTGETSRLAEEQHKQHLAKMAEYDRCNNANKVAGEKYTTATAEARRVYDEEIAKGERAIAETYYWMNTGQKTNLRLQYSNSAKSNHNAISAPSYREYVATVNSLKAEGCQITQVYRDNSW